MLTCLRLLLTLTRCRSILALENHGRQRNIDDLGKFSVQQLTALRFMGYHSPLQTQEDYIKALSFSQGLVDKIRKNLGLDVYAYSIFYVYFEQANSSRQGTSP